MTKEQSRRGISRGVRSDLKSPVTSRSVTSTPASNGEAVLLDCVQRMTYIVHLNRYTGYGEAVCQMFHWLQRMGLYLSVRPIALDEQWGKSSSVPLQMRAQVVQCRQPEEWELIIACPDTQPTHERKAVYFTMYESSEMPPQYVKNLNRAQAVVVPCRWNAENFAENGVTVPIHVCPLGFEPDVYWPTPVSMHGPCVFGVAGRTHHCARRKGVQDAIDLFLKTFPTDEGVRLHVKVHPDDDAKSTDHRVKISKSHFEPYEIGHWLRSLTAFVTLSRGEGFGLWPLHAMACGRPVIGAKYSGQADFMTEANSFVAKHRVVDAVSGQSNVEYLGQWAEINQQSAAQHMMTIRRNRQAAAEIGSVAAQWVSKMTWESAAARLFEILKTVGAVK